MATAAAVAQGNGQRAHGFDRLRTGRGGGAGRHRQLPLVVVGVLLVAGCALGFTDASLHLGSREQVLAVAQPVAAGQVLTSGDFRLVSLSTGGGVQSVPAGEESRVVGRRAAVRLVAGSLLIDSEVGAASLVGPGADVVAVGLKAGAYPPEVAAGDRVEVVPVVSSASGGGSGPPASGAPIGATVLAVDATSAGTGSPTVFSLQVAASDADEVASLAAAGQASLIEVGAGG